MINVSFNDTFCACMFVMYHVPQLPSGIILVFQLCLFGQYHMPQNLWYASHEKGWGKCKNCPCTYGNPFLPSHPVML